MTRFVSLITVAFVLVASLAPALYTYTSLA